MDRKPSSSKSITSTSSTNNVLSKLRRLRIEENLLLQNLRKFGCKRDISGIGFLDSEMLNDSEKTLKSLKDSYLDIKNLFIDVKTVSCTQDLAELDIDEVKSKVLELETALKSLKTYLNVELDSLRTAEQILAKQLEEINHKDMKNKRPKIVSANYNQAVPSPVRLLMTSPMKCSEWMRIGKPQSSDHLPSMVETYLNDIILNFKEVQEFQDFMKNSPNRYGGWIEYHHNIFVKYWHKHFGTFERLSFDESYVQGLALENFIDDVLLKLQGVDRESLIIHIEWYKKYLALKEKQQNAINKWKYNRRSMKKDTLHAGKDNGGKNTGMINKNCTKLIDDVVDKNYRKIDSKHSEVIETFSRHKKIHKLEKDDIYRLMKPTEQWLCRKYDRCETGARVINFIDNIERL